MSTAVGIDLGTTFSVVACLLQGELKPRVIPTDSGRAIVPSVVCFADGKILVGDEAKERQENGGEAAAFFKRAMGDPDFSVQMGGQTYSAIGLSALVLAYLRDVASAHLHEAVDRAVITVPAYFTNVRREATIQAGREAGLAVLSIISEPTAAARAYGLRPGVNGTVLVYDLGGGTFDVSLVKITATELRVVGTGGDHNLGGKDWDDRLLAWVADRFDQQFGGQLLESVRDDLLIEAEKVKRTLSARESATFTVRRGSTVGQYTMSRGSYEDLTRDLVERTRMLSEQVLDAAGVRWGDLDGIVPVGGSTRMPMVRTLLAQMSGREPLAGIQPDEAVALGAAIQAAEDLEAQEPSAPRFFLAGRRPIVDVMSHSLGMIAVSTDQSRYVNSILVKKNEPIPSQQTRRYSLRVGRRGGSRLEVFLTQGESTDPAACSYLGKYVFSGFADTSAQEVDVDVTYAYDRNGVVQVEAASAPTGHKLALTVEPLPDDVPARFAGAPAKSEPLTVYLVFDVSGSMSGEPLKEAQKAARAFAHECDLGAAVIGILVVSDTTRVVLKATENARKIEDAIAAISVGMTGGGNAGHPFDELLGLLQRQKGRRYAVVLADGVWSDQASAVARAKDCHAAGIEVIGVGFGGADRAFLGQISSADEGLFTDLRGLTEAFSSIARELADAGGATRLRART